MSLRALCQDCLRAPTFSTIAEHDAAHHGQFACPCGGEYCACHSCLEVIAGLEAGHRSKSKLPGLTEDVPSDWTAEDGVPAYVEEKKQLLAAMSSATAVLDGKLL